METIQSNQLLHPQLAEIKAQLDAASQKAVSIVNGVSLEQLKKRPQPDQWSIAECLVHLNLSSEAEINVLNDAYEQTSAKLTPAAPRFKMDAFGRFLKWMLEPPPMFFSKIKTTSKFQPVDVEPVSEILPAFLALQEQLKECVETANNLPLDQIMVISPFSSLAKYNLLSCFHILLAHERRHLWQAEKVKEALVH